MLHYNALQVMLGGKNIEEGFGIAYRVIQVTNFFLTLRLSH